MYLPKTWIQRILYITNWKNDTASLKGNTRDHVNTCDEMIEDGVRKAVYETTTDTSSDDLRKFQSFLWRNFIKYNMTK